MGLGLGDIMVPREFIDAVRDRINLRDYIGADVELKNAGQSYVGRSPFARDTTPSLHVYKDNSRGWWCYSTHQGHDIFDWIKATSRCNFFQALRIAAAYAGMEMPEQSDSAGLEEYKAQRETQALLTFAAMHYHACLTPEARSIYNNKYGFSDETIERFSLGWCDGTLAKAMREAGYTDTQLLSTGLFYRSDLGGIAGEHFRDRLVYPYWRRGSCVYMIARHIVPSDKEQPKQKFKKLLTHASYDYVSPHVQNTTLYNVDSVLGAEEVLITEGVSDCISAAQSGVACISPVTTRIKTSEVASCAELTKHAKRVVICNDSEANHAGEKGAIDTALALCAAGRDCYIGTLPLADGQTKIDVNEYARDHGGDALREVLSAAVPFARYYLEQIPKECEPATLAERLRPMHEALSKREPIVREMFDALVAKRWQVSKTAAKSLSTKAAKDSKHKEERKTVREAVTPLPSNGRPTINVTGKQASDIIDETNRAIVADSAKLIAAETLPGSEYPGVLVRGMSGLMRLADVGNGPALEIASQSLVYAATARVAKWEIERRDGPACTKPTQDIAATVVACPPDGLPIVERIETRPFFLASGELVRRQGYHRQARTWMSAPTNMRTLEMPERITTRHIDEAIKYINSNLFEGFPFDSEASRTHAFAALLMPFARRLIDGPTPLHLISAPMAGTGKSLLAKVIALVTTGLDVGARTLPDSTEEVRKMLTSELATGRAVICIDNIPTHKTLASEELAALSTSTEWRDRMLGTNRNIVVSNNALWLLTGNSPKLTGEIARRCIRIHLKANTGRPWLGRTFEHPNLPAWTLENRAELVSKCLQIIKYWVDAERPKSAKTLGTFEAWASTMGGILQTCGLRGLLDNADDLYEESDMQTQEMSEFVQAWWDKWTDSQVTPTMLQKFCTDRSLLTDVMSFGSEHAKLTKLAAYLRNLKDVQYDNFAIRKCKDSHRKSLVYKLEWTGEGDPPAPQLGANVWN